MALSGNPTRPHRRPLGFTLLELMVTVAIVALLATIGLNAYSSVTTKARRAAVQSHLQDLANRQEQLLLDARAYATSNTSPPMPALPADVTGHYTVTISADNSDTPPSFLITATPVGGQATQDTRCGTLTLNEAGTKTRTGSAPLNECW